VYWAADAGRGGRGDVVAGDVRRRHIVVDDGTGPVLVVYDDNDRFNLHGSPATLSVFEAELADALARGGPTGLSLAWSRYQAGRDDPVSEYSLG